MTDDMVVLLFIAILLVVFAQTGLDRNVSKLQRNQEAMSQWLTEVSNRVAELGVQRDD